MLFDSISQPATTILQYSRSLAPFPSRRLALCVAIAVFAVGVFAIGSNTCEAQSPPAVPPTPKLQPEAPTLDTIPVSPVPNPDQQQKKVQIALESDVLVTDSDPLFDDLLQLIRRKGSVLDGTILDPANESKVFSTEDQSGNASQQNATDDARAFAAESLLRSARLLSHLSAPDTDRRELISRMRLEAAKLLAP